MTDIEQHPAVVESFERLRRHFDELGFGFDSDDRAIVKDAIAAAVAKVNGEIPKRRTRAFGLDQQSLAEIESLTANGFQITTIDLRNYATCIERRVRPAFNPKARCSDG